MTLRVIAPFTVRQPDAERALREIAPDAEWWDVSGSIFAYSQLVENLWKEAETFLIIEHDIEVTAKAFAQALHCPCEWSVSPYRGPTQTLLTVSLGCTRFSSDLMQAMPDAVSLANAVDDAGTVVPPGDWHRLDCRLYSVLRGTGEGIRTPHLHDEVLHHHVFDGECACGKAHV